MQKANYQNASVLFNGKPKWAIAIVWIGCSGLDSRNRIWKSKMIEYIRSDARRAINRRENWKKRRVCLNESKYVSSVWRLMTTNGRFSFSSFPLSLSRSFFLLAPAKWPKQEACKVVRSLTHVLCELSRESLSRLSRSQRCPATNGVNGEQNVASHEFLPAKRIANSFSDFRAHESFINWWTVCLRQMHTGLWVETAFDVLKSKSACTMMICCRAQQLCNRFQFRERKQRNRRQRWYSQRPN